MVWFIHDRFGMVCSTTTCSKIKRKWLKVIEAEERGEHLDPAVAQEQVRQEALRVGKKSSASSRTQQRQGSETSSRANLHMPAAMELAVQQQQQSLPQYTTHIDQDLHEYEPSTSDQRLQEQLQTEVAHAALHHSDL